MAIPTEKSSAIGALLDSISGTNREHQILNDLCTWCKGPAKEFRDSISKREYAISGLCQKCQDETFGGGDD